jgi:hypothetical protein
MDNSSIGICDMQTPVLSLPSDSSALSSRQASTSLQTLTYTGPHDNVMRVVTSIYPHILQHLRKLNSLQITAMLAPCIVIYLTSLIVYRLYLSPIAAFPGPFLARTTHWYEFYYTYIQTSMYYKKVAEFQPKYGESDRC